ncbi:MAG: RNA polymerase sigma factor RpoH [Gammaproteobacteria bacterium]
MTTTLATTFNGDLLSGPLGSERAYINAVTQIPVMDRDREQELATSLREGNDLDAARDLVVGHLRFVVHIARGYNGYGLPFSDLIQEGNVGLMKAVKRFDPSVGVRLVSYAVHWIRAEIHEYVLRNWRVVKVATTKAQRKLFFNLRKSKKNLSWLNEDETQAVADDLGVSVKEVTEMEKRLSSRDLAFDPVPGNDEDGDFGPASYLPADDETPETIVANHQTTTRSEERLAAAMEILDERSRDIIARRWLTDKKTTLTALATEYGVSAERIRQVEANALKKLKQHVGE